jgi:hypothetical protein
MRGSAHNTARIHMRAWQTTSVGARTSPATQPVINELLTTTSAPETAKAPPSCVQGVGAARAVRGGRAILLDEPRCIAKEKCGKARSHLYSRATNQSAVDDSCRASCRNDADAAILRKGGPEMGDENHIFS